jgi:maltose alpha-D-glucosyltransferase/alpha-amylase
MERMIRMRKEVPEIGWGDFSFIPTRQREILAMRYSWRNNAVIFLHNLSSKPLEVRFLLKEDTENDCMLVNLLSNDHSQPEANDQHCVLLEPYGYRWYRVCGLDYILRRSAS